MLLVVWALNINHVLLIVRNGMPPQFIQPHSIEEIVAYSQFDEIEALGVKNPIWTRKTSADEQDEATVEVEAEEGSAEEKDSKTKDEL